ncbi:hypothetical protein UFOVP244_109 [uncultured Caudovirales phage]|uniref:Uncharacterized protein n=1 Tax=uncultured Caudovirales phage TaxID=2100421 RepID=A0A6J7WWK2_9CAUD|nr:hypothetical protein UFOVP244_109 [uncultured Caudovirales phage]
MVGVMIISFIVLIAVVAAVDILFSFIRWRMAKAEEAMINEAFGEMNMRHAAENYSSGRRTPPPPKPKASPSTNIYQMSRYRKKKKD